MGNFINKETTVELMELNENQLDTISGGYYWEDILECFKSWFQ